MGVKTWKGGQNYMPISAFVFFFVFEVVYYNESNETDNSTDPVGSTRFKA